jgi:5'(3')-deoxyribonucleotidase
MEGTTVTFTLGLDLDGVCGDYTAGFRHFVARDAGVTESSIGEQTHWSFVRSGWPLRDEDHFHQVHAHAVRDGLFRMMPPIAGVSENLWRLSDAGVYIKVITHRLCVNGTHATAAGDTVAWLDAPTGPIRDGVPAARVPYRDICFTADKTQVGADIYIDDAPHNITALRAAGATVICFDAPYNRTIDGLRARTWDEAADLVLAEQERIGAAARV